MNKERLQLANRRRWLRLIPLAFITYSLAYLDRANYSFGVAGGMGEDLNITAGVSSFIAALFFLGYFFFQVPGALYAEKKSAKKLVFWSLILWGLLATATGLAPSVNWLYPIRFLLGVVESAVMPAMLIFLSHWFLKEERSRANTFLILGNPVTVLWMSVMSGYLISAFDWRWMFIIQGVPAIIWAFFWWKLAKDRPKDVNWLSSQEKKDLDAALKAEQSQLKPVKNYREAFKSKPVILLCFQYFTWSIGVYGFVMWLPSIIKNASTLNIVATGWLSAAPYLLAVILMLTVSYFSDKTLNRKTFVWVSLLVGAFAFYGSYALGDTNFWLSYTLLIVAGGAMYAPYGPFFAIIPEILPSNVAGGAMALINSMGALGSFVGAYFVGYLNGLTGGPSASYIFMAGSLFASVLFTLAVKTPSSKIGKEKQKKILSNKVVSS
jgi:sugar phosphate permease